MEKKQKSLSPLGTRMLERFKDLGLSQTEVARQLGVTQTAVSQIMSRGSTKILHKIATVLKTTIVWLEDGTPPKVNLSYDPPARKPNGGAADGLYTGKVWQMRTSTETLVPVYGPLTNGTPGVLKFTEEYIIEYDPMPPELMNIKNGFKMYVHEDGMEPRHFRGEKISVHPHKPPAVEKDCVLVKKDGSAFIKRYMGETATEYKFMQWNPESNFKVKKTEIIGIYAVIR